MKKEAKATILNLDPNLRLLSCRRLLDESVGGELPED
jgi:hypothetical protein